MVVSVIVVITLVCAELCVCGWEVTTLVTVATPVEEQEVEVVAAPGSWTVVVRVTVTVAVSTPFCVELEFTGAVAELLPVVVVVAAIPELVTVVAVVEAVSLTTRYPATPAAATTATTVRIATGRIPSLMNQAPPENPLTVGARSD